jgi:hypothetical protein
MAACAKASVAPWFTGCWGLPSIFVGRPWCVSTSRPMPAPANGIAVA